jgi:hypothetical protein
MINLLFRRVFVLFCFVFCFLFFVFLFFVLFLFLFFSPSQAESLLSTHGAEANMLGDMEVAVNSLRNFTFKFSDASESLSGSGIRHPEKQNSKLKKYEERRGEERERGEGREKKEGGGEE